MHRTLLALWQYRRFVLSSIRTELATRFARSTLGGLWIILNPLAQVAIYALILGNILSARLDGIDSRYSFPIYLTAGMLAWSLFSQVVNRSLDLFISNAGLVKKVKFPKVVLPAAVAGTSLLDNLLLLTAILSIFAVLGHTPTLQLLWLPVLTLATLALGVGCGLILGILNVFIRDVGQVVPIILQVGFWFTPIVYPLSIIPESYRGLLRMNPLVGLVETYHSVLVFGTPPDLTAVAVILAVSMLLLVLGFFLFHRANEEMADVL